MPTGFSVSDRRGSETDANGIALTLFAKDGDTIQTSLASVSAVCQQMMCILCCADVRSLWFGPRGPFAARSGALSCMAMVVLGLSLSLTGGCAHDAAISVRELIELEASLARTVPSNEPATPAQRVPLAVPEETPYRLEAGDLIQISLSGVNEIDPAAPTSITAHIATAGTILLPYKTAPDGPDPGLKVAGLKIEDAEKMIHDALVPAYFTEVDHNVVVRIVVEEFTPTTVTVYGAVAQPGPVGLRANQRSPLSALAAAGWISTASGRVFVKSIRGTEHDQVYDLHRPADMQRALTAAPLNSGDIVFVEPEAPKIFYFTGLLNGGGQLAFSPGQPVTFLQALASAGGRDPITDPVEAILTRSLPNGESVRVRLELKKLEQGKDPNFLMRTGDLVMVPHTFRTRTREFLNQSVRFSAGASANVSYDPITESRFDRQLEIQGFRGGGGLANQNLGVIGIPNFFQPAFPAAPTP